MLKIFVFQTYELILFTCGLGQWFIYHFLLVSKMADTLFEAYF